MYQICFFLSSGIRNKHWKRRGRWRKQVEEKEGEMVEGCGDREGGIVMGGRIDKQNRDGGTVPACNTLTLY